MSILSDNSVLIIGVLGALVFITQVIVQVLKDLPGISKVPTKLVVIIVSMFVTIFAMLAYIAYAQLVMYWYYMVLAVVGGFVVAYISIYGWDTLMELKNRYTK